MALDAGPAAISRPMRPARGTLTLMQLILPRGRADSTPGTEQTSDYARIWTAPRRDYGALIVRPGGKDGRMDILLAKAAGTGRRVGRWAPSEHRTRTTLSPLPASFCGRGCLYLRRLQDEDTLALRASKNIVAHPA